MSHGANGHPFICRGIWAPQTVCLSPLHTRRAGKGVALPLQSPTTTTPISPPFYFVPAGCFCFDPCFPPAHSAGVVFYLFYTTRLPIVSLHRRFIVDFKSVKKEETP